MNCINEIYDPNNLLLTNKKLKERILKLINTPNINKNEVIFIINMIIESYEDGIETPDSFD